LSSYPPSELLSDRTKFKLYAAESHLNKLKDLEAGSGNLSGSETRIFTELEIDCFFSQIVGAKDSLLFQINEKLGLGILFKDVEIGRVQGELGKKGKEKLLKKLHSAMRENNWPWLLNEFRNQGVNRNFIRKHVAVGPTSARVSLIYKKKKKKSGQQNNGRRTGSNHRDNSVFRAKFEKDEGVNRWNQKT
jgi:hypothetical protein